jgi:hypothetical protein
MASRRTRAKSSLAQQAAELALAVPQVVAHRMTRMALAGAHPSPRDRKEFARMVAEKNEAFGAAWQAMTVHGARAQQAFGASLFAPSSRSPAAGGPRRRARWPQLQHATLGILGKGLGPVHRKAVANAKRLARTKLR